MKTPDCNDLKLGTIVGLDTMSKPIDFGFKRSRVRIRVRLGLELGLLPADHKLWRNAAGVTEYIPCDKFAPLTLCRH